MIYADRTKKIAATFFAVTMDFEIKATKVFERSAAERYINDCCVGGDEILGQIKKDIARQMNTNENSIEIYQEDWGWALEVLKDKVVYLIGINNTSVPKAVESLFSVFTRATRKENKLFLNQTIAAELSKFSEIVLRLFEENGFEVYKYEI